MLTRYVSVQLFDKERCNNKSGNKSKKINHETHV